MKKRNRIIYWTSTIFLSFAMLAGGIQQTFQIGGYNEIVTALHYPLYMLSIIGTWKCLGVIALLIPGFPVLKEWAYAGFFFVLSGAAISHFVCGEPFITALPALILLVVTILSRHFRPPDRKTSTAKI
ncbi:MAG: DoxX family protein [Sphingobacteriales bacterium]|nr:MAG: DoxX family protein [Sphingobacteriales bacterium]